MNTGIDVDSPPANLESTTMKFGFQDRALFLLRVLCAFLRASSVSEMQDRRWLSVELAAGGEAREDGIGYGREAASRTSSSNDEGQNFLYILLWENDESALLQNDENVLLVVANCYPRFLAEFKREGKIGGGPHGIKKFSRSSNGVWQFFTIIVVCNFVRALLAKFRY